MAKTCCDRQLRGLIFQTKNPFVRLPGDRPPRARSTHISTIFSPPPRRQRKPPRNRKFHLAWKGGPITWQNAVRSALPLTPARKTAHPTPQPLFLLLFFGRARQKTPKIYRNCDTGNSILHRSKKSTSAENRPQIYNRFPTKNRAAVLYDSPRRDLVQIALRRQSGPFL